ncbi:MAG: PHP domain-containing protein [Candidatus Zixiibacteriota bacterium]|nr:MAG: PHP domain-containing protein [candidate division Zixibacteria bacterium]
MPRYIDLHIHTDCSDGVLDPGDVLDRARQLDLQAFSITDHDTLEGYRSAAALRRETDPELLAGIELSVDINGDDLHLLGYLFDPDDRALGEALADFQKERNQRGRRMVEKLREMGLDIGFGSVEEKAAGAVIGRPHIADAMYSLNLVNTYEEAFFRYIGNGRPAYLPKGRMKPDEAMKLIHGAGGIAVLAHPYVGKAHRHIEMLVPLGLDGIEIFHYAHTRQNIAQLKGEADRFGLVQTGGSDYHGRQQNEDGIGLPRVSAKLLAPLDARTREVRTRR